MLLLLLEFLPPRPRRQPRRDRRRCSRSPPPATRVCRVRDAKRVAVRGHVRPRRRSPCSSRCCSARSARWRCCCRGTTSSARASTTASTTRCCCSATLGMIVMAASNDLITIFLGLELMSLAALRAGRLPPQPARVERGGAQVLPARRVRERVPALRHRAALRRHRHHQPGADGGVPRRLAARSATRCWSRAALLVLVGLRLQGGGGARSTCGRPTPTRARRPGHRLHVGRGQGRRLRRAAARRAASRCRRPPGRLAAAARRGSRSSP